MSKKEIPAYEVWREEKDGETEKIASFAATGGNPGGGGGSSEMYNLADYVTFDWANMVEESDTHYYVPCTTTLDNFKALFDLIKNKKTIFLEDLSSRDYDYEHFVMIFNDIYYNENPQYDNYFELKLGVTLGNTGEGSSGIALFKLILRSDLLNNGKLHLHWIEAS